VVESAVLGYSIAQRIVRLAKAGRFQFGPCRTTRLTPPPYARSVSRVGPILFFIRYRKAWSMAARSSKVQLTDSWREKIRTSMLINRLQNHVAGRIDMTPTQLRAAEILLKKRLPDLSASELSGPGGGPIEVATPLQAETAQQILERIRADSRTTAGS
jgi:hypothetical protein